MFSGLTNQVSSWMGKAQDEEVPTPPQSATALNPEESVQNLIENVEIADPENPDQKQSPTKAAGGMFSNVKSSMTGWLGNVPNVSMPAMPSVSMPTVSMPSIPGLRKNQATDEAAAGGEEGAQADPAIEAQPAHTNEDDDRSSATGGADSRNVSEKGSPTEEQAGAVGNVTHKVTAGAKSFGSFLYGAVNKAGAKIKESVKDNTILGEFNKEQDAFIKDQSGKSTEPGTCPWIGHSNEDKIKEEILSLSADRRNFVRAPPAGIEFEFNYDASYATALALMAEDSSLEKMRFDLVPKIITEEHFWRNYFYRVSLIIQAGDLGTLGTDDAFGKRDADEDVSSDKPKESTVLVKEVAKVKTVSESEFISDKFIATEKDFAEIQENINKLGLGMGKEAENEEQWEKDLEAEIQDFEVVDDTIDEQELDQLDLK
ncbi:unnamed protein product [Diamesa tonsa]